MTTPVTWPCCRKMIAKARRTRQVRRRLGPGPGPLQGARRRGSSAASLASALPLADMSRVTRSQASTETTKALSPRAPDLDELIIARPGPGNKRPCSPATPQASSKRAATETKGESIKRMLSSKLPPYAFDTPPRLHIKIHNPETGGKKWVLAKISSNPERHAGADQTSCRPPCAPPVAVHGGRGDADPGEHPLKPLRTRRGPRQCTRVHELRLRHALYHGFQPPPSGSLM